MAILLLLFGVWSTKAFLLTRLLIHWPDLAPFVALLYNGFLLRMLVLLSTRTGLSNRIILGPPLTMLPDSLTSILTDPSLTGSLLVSAAPTVWGLVGSRPP